MEVFIVQSEDGSHTLFVPSLKEHYHSIHGAVNESRTVFIKNGLLSLDKHDLSILEIGFGTGLNAFLSFLESKRKNIRISYTAIEKHPLPGEIYSRLNYPDSLDASSRDIFLRMHDCDWNESVRLSEEFLFRKVLADIRHLSHTEKYDLVYFDAFAPDVQPDLWEEEVFKRLAEATLPGGVLVTYSSKGIVRRRIEKSGFEVSKLPGPPGKREVIRAVKLPVVS